MGTLRGMSVFNMTDDVNSFRLVGLIYSKVIKLFQFGMILISKFPSLTKFPRVDTSLMNNDDIIGGENKTLFKTRYKPTALH